MSKSRLSTALIVLGMAVVGACGGESDKDGNDGEGVTSKPMTKEEFAQTRAHSLCTRSASCCGKFGATPLDSPDCESLYRQKIMQQIDEHTKAAGVSYDAAKAGECAAWTDKLVAQCTRSDAELASYNAACEGMWAGSVKEGEPCTESTQCAGHETGVWECKYDFSSMTCEKAAQVPAHAVKGAACGGTCWSTIDGPFCNVYPKEPGGANCWIDDGLFCAGDNTCIEAIPVGGACGYDFYCVSTAFCHAGVCRERIAQGGACDPSTTASTCKDGLWCDTASATCAKQSGAGAACVAPRSCVSGRCEFGKCVPEDAFLEADMCAGK